MGYIPKATPYTAGEAFPHLSDELLQRAAIVYVKVSFVESWRKNRLRFNPDRPDSILKHALPDHKLERLYRQDDWAEFSATDPEFVTVKGIRVPYVVFENEDDVTTAGGEALGRRLEEVLGRLWTLGNRPEVSPSCRGKACPYPTAKRGQPQGIAPTRRKR